MSLLDDVSIVVTPNGYKAGELYAVIPVPTEGAELLDCNNFDCAVPTDVWTQGTSGGTIDFSNSQVTITGNDSFILQSNLMTIGKNYKLTINVDSIDTNSGTVIVALGSGSDPAKQSLDQSGNLTFYFYDITFGSNWIQIFTTSDATVTVNSISVKEYTSADMDVTRATAATRVDENGLVNYAEILGGEEIDNGKFTTNLDSWSTSSWWVWNSLGAYHPSTSLHKPLYQQCCVIGKTYLITFDLNCVGLSLAKFSLGSSTGSTTQTIDINLTTGSYSYFVTAAAEYIVFNRQNTAEYYVNNVSVKEVTRDNVPRIDYTGGGCPHILAEPMRTNTTTRSNELDLWGAKSNVTITPDYSLSPDGSINSNRLLFSANGFTHNNLTQVISTIYSISVYAKRNSGTENVGFFVNGSGAVNYAFNLTNEWQRFEYTYTSTNTSTFGIAGLSGADVSIFGFQSEVASYPTSYIPTSGSTVTRNQDIFTRDGIGSLINSTEGVLFVEMAALSDDGTDRRLSLSNGTVGNAINIGLSRFSGNINAEIHSGGVLQTSGWGATGVTQTNNNKFALSWGSGAIKFYVNGSPTNTDTGITSPIGLNSLKLSSGDDTLNLFAKVKQLQVFKTSLSDTQLAALTSL